MTIPRATTRDDQATLWNGQVGQSWVETQPVLDRMFEPFEDAIVRGVVESTGTIDSFTPEGEAILLRINAPAEILRYVIMKGPVAIDGISLTVMAKDDHSFTVSLVQYTQEHTNLGARKPGDRVNLETDIIARYVEAMLEDRKNGTAGAELG